MGIELPGGEAVWVIFEHLVRGYDDSGLPLDHFEKRFDAFVHDNGWSHLFPARYAAGYWDTCQLILRTQSSFDYAERRRAQLLDGNFAFWVYKTGNDHLGYCHPSHAELDGIALPPSHAFWARYAPPNCWGCSCRIRGANSEKGILRASGIPGKPLPDWWNSTDPATGLPPGIAPLFDGRSCPNLRQIVDALIDGSARQRYL